MTELLESANEFPENHKRKDAARALEIGALPGTAISYIAEHIVYALLWNPLTQLKSDFRH